MSWSIFIYDARYLLRQQKRWYAGQNEDSTLIWTSQAGWANKYGTIEKAIKIANQINESGGYHIFVAPSFDYKDNVDHAVKITESGNQLEIEL